MSHLFLFSGIVLSCFVLQTLQWALASAHSKQVRRNSTAVCSAESELDISYQISIQKRGTSGYHRPETTLVIVSVVLCISQLRVEKIVQHTTFYFYHKVAPSSLFTLFCFLSRLLSSSSSPTIRIYSSDRICSLSLSLVNKLSMYNWQNSYCVVVRSFLCFKNMILQLTRPWSQQTG